LIRNFRAGPNGAALVREDDRLIACLKKYVAGKGRDPIIKYGNSFLPRVRSGSIGNPEIEKEEGMVGVLLVKPLLLLGGAGYLAYRLLQKTVNSLQVGKEEEEFIRSGGIEMKPCAKCGMYIRSDAAQCPCCNESKDSPLRSG
jgi:hypothetical protein